LIVLPTPANSSARDRIFALAARYRLPAVYPFRYYATGGGLMSYGFDTLDLYRRSAAYFDHILKGADEIRTGDKPKTAKAVGLTVPHSLLSRADELID
jgi:putative ABC transport system substrate-binding protein